MLLITAASFDPLKLYQRRPKLFLISLISLILLEANTLLLHQPQLAFLEIHWVQVVSKLHSVGKQYYTLSTSLFVLVCVQLMESNRALLWGDKVLECRQTSPWL